MEKFNKLTQLQKIILLIIMLLLLITLYNVFKTLSYNMSKKKIDYVKFNVNTEISNLNKETSKAIYYSLEDAIVKYLNSYQDTEGQIGMKPEEKFVSYKKFYSILTSDYKKYLGKSNYEKKSVDFLDKFYVKVEISDSDKSYGSVDTKNVIKNIYVFDNNRYICEVSNDTKKITGYIGIELNPSNSKWYIFYIE